MDYEIRNVGEAAVLVVFGHTISPDIQRKIQSLEEYTEAHPFDGFEECVASYTGLTVYYNPWKVFEAYPDKRPGDTMRELISSYVHSAEMISPSAPRQVEIPVCYGGVYGPDLSYVAEFHHMTQEEVVKIHTAPEYLVYMLGFCPGFPYMGGMDRRIATPRRASPRLAIPAGSIGIAGEQTGGYPLSTPGGWQLIGRTPVDMFRPDNQEEPTLLKAGDHVRFRAVSEEEYKRIRGEKS
ncbi:5-oxoprolinase subunit PxpB [Dialister sp.]|uniref:5-oxoprolinase subunit PxpB n=1 Tax=Dialister sp. TaxID=1955814 RepID=UPI003F02484C